MTALVDYLAEGALAAVILALASATLGLFLGILHDVLDQYGVREAVRKFLIVSGVVVGILVLLLLTGYLLVEVLDTSLIELMEKEKKTSIAAGIRTYNLGGFR